MKTDKAQLGLAGKIADLLLDSPVVPLFVIASLLLGAYALLITPREDRPDINVPSATVLIPWPGAGVETVDEQLARRGASWVREIPAVSEVRSSSSNHAALLSIEFEAGTAKSDAFSRLDELFSTHADELPENAGTPQIQTYGESRLVVFMATLASKTIGPAGLDDIAGELSARLLDIPGVRDVDRFGGAQAAVEILPRPTELAGRNIPLDQLARAVGESSLRVPAGRLEGSAVTDLQAGMVFNGADQLGRIPVGRDDGGPIYLDQVAVIRPGRVDRNQAVLHWHEGQSMPFPAVTLAITTLEGKNVSDVTEQVRARLAQFEASLLPDDVRLEVTQDAGAEATERVYTVLFQLLSGTLIVVGIIWLGLGWRAATIIAIMMPASLSIVPYLYHHLDFTLNPVSIAAMILAIGILSDDAVVMLENIARHFQRAGERTRELTVKAVNEVGNPTILADVLVVATLLPTAFITGEMGQYVRAIPIGASAAVLFSLLIALTITPYFGYRLLKGDGRTGKSARQTSGDDATADRSLVTGTYRYLLTLFLDAPWLRWLFYLGLVVLLIASFALVALRVVQVGLTPLLDRDLFAVNIDLPPESTLSESLTVASAINGKLREIPEVEGVTIYSGLRAPLIYPPETLASPERKAPRDLTLHVILAPEEQRKRQSYEVSRDVGHRLGDWLSPYDSEGHVSRIPSGPSSDRAITAEIYGPTLEARREAAQQVEEWLKNQKGVISTDHGPPRALPTLDLNVNPERAATFGVIPAEVTRELYLAIEGETVANLQTESRSREPIPVIVRLGESDRDTQSDLESLYVMNADDEPVSLDSIVDFESGEGQRALFRRGLLPVHTVFADLDRSQVQPLTVQLESLNGFDGNEITWLAPPEEANSALVYWSGEWEMTRNVYRDLALAGLGVMIIIYVLLAGWFRSYRLPILIMLPIPLIFIGVIPAHWLWGINIAGMGVLGVIALGGIVTRNSILLVDFIEKRLEEGMDLKQAVLQAGTQRFRPILLTAATVMFGSGVLIFEPSLEPLGLTLASGVLVSTLLTLVLVPVLYYHVANKPKSRLGPNETR